MERVAISYTDPKVDPGTLLFLEQIGTFSAANPVEIRGQGNPGGRHSACSASTRRRCSG
jgi:hypothetical protein